MNPDGTQDSNAVNIYGVDSGKVFAYESIDGSRGTAALKITSRCANLRVAAGRLIGGSENCVDLNNECRDITISCDTYVVRGKYAISAKTCKGIRFEGHISGIPTEWHVNLGSWSDQSKEPQTDTRLYLTADIYPIKVWVGNADIPILDNPKKYRIIGFGRFGKTFRKLVMILWDMGKRLNIA